MRFSARNLAAAGAGTGVAASSSHSLYPASGLVDGDPTHPWIAASSGVTNAALTVDLAVAHGESPGGYESGYAAIGEDRSSGGGSLANEASIVHGGSGALKMLAGAGGVGRHVTTHTVRPGETWRYSAWLRGDGTGSARLRVYDPITGLWWVSGAWQASEGDVAARSTATWAEYTGAITIDDYDAHQVREFSLEVHTVCSDSGQVGYADDLYLWPAWDLVSLHGHNWPPALGCEVSGSDDGSTWTVLSTGTPTRPACYVLLDALQTYRHVRARAVGTAPVQLYAGELGVWQSVEPSEYPLVDRNVDVLPLQVRRRAGRRQLIAHFATDAARSVRLRFEHATAADHNAFRAALWDASRWGADLVVVVPSTDEADVYLGRLAEGLGVARGGPEVHAIELLLEEDGFPTVGL